jgi:hypothetical protein
MGPAIYHHHFHNAVVGNHEPAGRYNAKWRSKQGNLGEVKVGDFLRGQGGLMCKLSRPYTLKEAPELFIEAEQRRTLIDLGYNDRWHLNQTNAKYKKPKHLIHSPEEIRNHNSSELFPTLKGSNNHLVNAYAGIAVGSKTKIPMIK